MFLPSFVSSERFLPLLEDSFVYDVLRNEGSVSYLYAIQTFSTGFFRMCFAIKIIVFTFVDFRDFTASFF